MKKQVEKYFLGIMSGTSLDGLDMALCKFTKKQELFDYEIIKTHTFSYSDEWYNLLSNCQKTNALELIKLHKHYGQFIGQKVNKFLENCEISPNFISSHGHTIFHQPEKRLTFQIGDGAYIAAETGISVISDFRNLDVALGGQGAPLVPVGDKLLFSDYDYCLNIGGFANLSFDNNKTRKAFDICPANIILNIYANKFNLKYDKDGLQGRQGRVLNELLKELDKIEYYQRTLPKSLGREWLESNFITILTNNNYENIDVLHTLYQHISNKLADEINEKGKTVLVTGGGAFNKYLIELFRNKSECEIIIPDDKLVNYKEAIIFAFLGFLNINNEINCLAEVTGASHDNIGGCVFRI